MYKKKIQIECKRKKNIFHIYNIVVSFFSPRKKFLYMAFFALDCIEIVNVRIYTEYLLLSLSVCMRVCINNSCVRFFLYSVNVT